MRPGRERGEREEERAKGLKWKNRADEREREREKEDMYDGDGYGNAVSVMVEGRRSSLRAFRYHFSTVLLRKHVAWYK